MHRRMRRLLPSSSKWKKRVGRLRLHLQHITREHNYVRRINGHYSSRGGILENLIHELIESQLFEIWH